MGLQILRFGRLTYGSYSVGCGMWWRVDKAAQKAGRIKMANLMISDTVRSNIVGISNSSNGYLVAPGDFERVRFRESVPENPAGWYCEVCRCPAIHCFVGSTLVHELVKVAFHQQEGGLLQYEHDGKVWDEAAWAKEVKEADLLRQQCQQDDSVQWLDWRTYWSSGEVFDSFEVEWEPSKPSASIVERLVQRHEQQNGQQ